MCGGRERPPYNAAYTVVFPATPAWRTPLPGGIYASPTNEIYTSTNQIRCHRANTHGPHACGPYKPTGDGRQMGKADVCRRPARLRTRAGFQNGSPDEPFRQERNGIVTESRCLARNANRLGRPPQSPGVSKGARRTWGKAGGPEAPNRLPDGSRCKERGRGNTVCIASLSDAADAAGW